MRALASGVTTGPASADVPPLAEQTPSRHGALDEGGATIVFHGGPRDGTAEQVLNLPPLWHIPGNLPAATFIPRGHNFAWSTTGEVYQPAEDPKTHALAVDADGRVIYE